MFKELHYIFKHSELIHYKLIEVFTSPAISGQSPSTLHFFVHRVGTPPTNGTHSVSKFQAM